MAARLALDLYDCTLGDLEAFVEKARALGANNTDRVHTSERMEKILGIDTRRVTTISLPVRITRTTIPDDE